MLQVNSLSGFGASQSLPISLINNGVLAESASNLSSYSFTDYNIGNASSTRRVIIAVSASNVLNSLAAITSFTIGGISVTIDSSALDGIDQNSSTLTAIGSATVPTGTTATINISFNNAMTGCACYAVSIDNLENVAPFSTDTDISTTVLQTTLNWKKNGFIIGAAAHSLAGTGISWSGITEQNDSPFGVSDGLRFSGATLFPTSDATLGSISATISGSSTRRTLAVASYR